VTPAPDPTTVESQSRAAQPVVSIRAVIPIDRLGAVTGTATGALSDYLRQTGAQPAGPFFVRYHTFGPTDTDMETGVPVAAPVAGAGRICGGVLPGGPAFSTWRLGPHQRLGEAYARLDAWLQTPGRGRAALGDLPLVRPAPGSRRAGPRSVGHAVGPAHRIGCGSPPAKD
jgi:hypothetical protein